MTKNEAINRLKDWGGYIGIISGIEEEIREMKLMIEYNRSLKGLSFDGMPKAAAVKKPTEAAAIKNIAVIEQEIKAARERIKHEEEKKAETDSFVESLDQTEQRILRLRYIKKKTWQSISMRIYLSLRQCYRVHGRILDKMCRYFEAAKNSANDLDGISDIE